ncbi:MAG: O-antigen ligase family protein [Bacteroidota bacterium]
MKFQKWGLILLFFFIAFGNSDTKIIYWFFQSGVGGPVYNYYNFVITSLLVGFLLYIKYFKMDEPPLTNHQLIPKNSGISMAIMLWFLAATLSLIKNISVGEVIKNHISGVMIPVVIYLALRRISLTKTDINRILTAVSLGILTTLVLGLLAYYQEWGFPSLATLAYSKYSLVRMERFMNVTYGNVGLTAQLLLLTGPPLLASIFDRNKSKKLRLWFGFCVFLIGLNLLILQSLTALIVFILIFILILAFQKRYKLLLMMLILAVVLPLVFRDFLLDVSYLLLGRQGSVLERIGAMQEGWGVFLDNWIFGVGKGVSYLYLSADTAHQFFIQQAVELGVLGFIASLLLVGMVFTRLLIIYIQRHRNPDSETRFLFIIGPFSYLLYGVIANITTNIGTLNIWINLLFGCLSLVDFVPANKNISIGQKTTALPQINGVKAPVNSDPIETSSDKKVE